METTETKIIPLVEMESYKLLPTTTQKLLTEIAEELKIDGLTTFNPIVEAMITIEGFKSLKFKEDDDESVKGFKEAKKTIRSFNASTKRAKKTLKAPFLETGKKLDKFEKVFLEKAKTILTSLEKEFQPYLDAEAQKKADREAKKNAKQTEQIEELTEADKANQLIIARMESEQAVNKRINAIMPAYMEKLENYSEKALQDELVYLESVQLLFDDKEKESLLDEQKFELKDLHDQAIGNVAKLVKMRLDDIERAKKLEAQPEPETAQPIQESAALAEEPKPDLAIMMAPPGPNEVETFLEQVNLHLDTCILGIASIQTLDDKELAVQGEIDRGLKNFKVKIEQRLEM
jgi:hypothetical protein